MGPGRKKLVLFGAFVVVVCLVIILYLGTSMIPKFVVKVNENDFRVIDIRYEQIRTRGNESIGLLKLTVQTNRDNLLIIASSEKNEEPGCTTQFAKAGLHEVGVCIGDPGREFLVSPIDIEHEFKVCANLPWSVLYEREPACKPIVLPPYQE